MMSNRAYQSLISEQEYLEGELHSDIKHEYIDGVIYAMSGASAAHNRITVNILREFGNHLKGKPCQPYSADMKVKIGSKYFYPDVLVDCTDLADDQYFTDNPTIIVEVLSKSTKQIDKTVKFNTYIQIPSLQEYLLVEQDTAEVEVLRRRTNWKAEHYFLGDVIKLDSIDLTIKVADIYDRVKNTDVLEWLEKQAKQTTPEQE
ncbi:Uma2 family endonuclease [Acinetobacter sp.]|uniref:Uma2 family endonuclease n=1 Tax=Acinetobacter sp. TaxID=472 RepID=UPI002FDA698D